ncbi:hypothetical protein AA18889_1577 [Acetobacter senegalensis DSM 18889]|nr:hypothetical protein AA18889_1577 [Acetobacter senegalensis DSM 18889]
MRTIGIRAAPKLITFAIYDTTTDAIVNVETIKIPAAFNVPEALKYIRCNILDVLREYSIEKAGLRVTESNSQSLNIDRIQIEGVIQESFASSDLYSYYIAQISSISKRIGIKRSDFKPLINGGAYPAVENWGKMTKEAREAILCAIGAENA